MNDSHPKDQTHSSLLVCFTHGQSTFSLGCNNLAGKRAYFFSVTLKDVDVTLPNNAMVGQSVTGKVNITQQIPLTEQQVLEIDQWIATNAPAPPSRPPTPS